MPRVNRRSVLRGAAGAVGLTAVDVEAADGRAQYLLAGADPGLRERVEDAGFRVRRPLGEGRVLVVVGDAGAEDRLRELPPVEDAVRDRLFARTASTGGSGTGRASSARGEPAGDGFSTEQWDKRVTGVPEAHETATGEGSRIAVMDSGIWADHPDLSANVDRDLGRTFTAGGPVAERGDFLGHGTHVAGIAAADDDGAGIVGTAPDAELVSLAIFYLADVDGDGDREQVVALRGPLEALDYAIDIGADAVNMSWGGWIPVLPPATGRFLRRAFDVLLRSAPAKTVPIAAAGNENRNLRRSTFVYPASIDRAITVGATGPNDRRAYYSNVGGGIVDVAAPGGGYERLLKTRCAASERRPDGRGEACGVEVGGEPDQCVGCELPEWPYPTNGVYSTLPPDSVIARELGIRGKRYGHMYGTSMAAPQVAGAVALVREVAPEMPGRRVEQLLSSAADAVPEEGRAAVGDGRLNVARAVDAAT